MLVFVLVTFSFPSFLVIAFFSLVFVLLVLLAFVVLFLISSAVAFGLSVGFFGLISHWFGAAGNVIITL